MYDSYKLEDTALIISQNKPLGIHKLPENALYIEKSLLPFPIKFIISKSRTDTCVYPPPAKEQS